ncbi:Tripartite-type tricarboxylate transporter, receptor component TctC [Lentibacillus persicus]|uniref:Tripartite-type tricarboxylate transporter, receptor component TctC n=1 Tax=Lentibacillus persicus TaxID=640948 RepID=A0A1I2A2N7_9BACI|nr:tripartite tricarboxylate transporter substrate-binding protein [Lentibacillus persicus]SFE38079.1 Tripartite-type tricarboxylate transporter, receptor component TctC [Lentibacillus persicus]
MKKLIMFLMAALLIAVLAACGSDSSDSDAEAESENTSGEEASEGETGVDLDRVRVLIGSTSTGGDTYQNADAVTRYMEKAMDTNMKVDAVGALRAFDELSKADDDGSTIMFFHDMAYLGVEYGSFDQEHELENWTIGPVVATNPGNAFLTSGDAPYDTMAESAEWLNENPDETITVAIESGGVSEVVFDGYYLWVKEEYGTEVSDRILAYVTGSQEDKNQALWDGNADIIHGSIGANNQYTEDGVENKIKMKFLGITAGERVEGFDIPTFAEQGITVNGKEFVFDKEFFFLMPKNIDENFASKLDEAVTQVAENEDYAADLKKNTYVVNHKPADEAKEYLMEKRDNFRYIIENAPSLDDIAQ